MNLYNMLYPIYRATGLSNRLRYSRFNLIERTLHLKPGESVLEVGCAEGIDFMAFAVKKYVTTGIDIEDRPKVVPFDFQILDGTKMPWPDKHFDAAISIGVFEHIQPIMSLCAATKEISRVAKRFCVIVPSNGTLIEPHTWWPFWQVRDRTKRLKYDALNYFSDDAWLQFPGFEDARTFRYWHAPGVQNLVITNTVR